MRGGSIRLLVDGAASALGDGAAGALLSAAPRGSLLTHALVPDMLRGVPSKKAKLLRRCETVAESLRKDLRGRYAAARPLRADDADAIESAPLLLQLLLLEPELLVVSLSPASAHHSGVGHWPVRQLGGFVDCSLDGDMPSSAYRKLLESFVRTVTEHVTPKAGAAFAKPIVLEE